MSENLTGGASITTNEPLPVVPEQPSKWHSTFLQITQGNALISVLAAQLPLASPKPATTGRDRSARRTSKVTLPRSSPGGEGGGRDSPADRKSEQMSAARSRR